MNPSEAALALGLASAIDNRQVGEASARAWADLMPNLVLADVQAAIKHHFATSTEYLMPEHVIRHVAVLRDERTRVVDVPPFPRELGSNPRAEQAWKRVYRESVVDGATPAIALGEANGALNISTQVEPLAIGAGDEAMTTMKDQMNDHAAALARKQSLARADREARAAEFAEKKRRHRESVAAQEADAEVPL